MRCLPPITAIVRRFKRRLAAVVVFGALLTVTYASPAFAVVDDLETVANNITAWIQKIAFAFTVLCFTVGGIRYVMAGTSGEPGEYEKSKRTFKAGGIGFLVVLMAKPLVEILKGFVGA